MGTVKTISESNRAAQDRTKQNTHQSLATGQLFVLTEMATSGSSFAIFLVRPSAQVRSAEEPSLCTQQKPERSISHQILLSSSLVSGPPCLLKDPLLASEGMNSAHLFHPHGAWTSTETHSLWHSLPSLLLHQQINGKINTGQQADSIPTFKFPWNELWSFGVFNFMIEGYQRKNHGLGNPKARLWKPSLQTIYLFLKRGPGRHTLEQETGFLDSGAWWLLSWGHKKLQTWLSDWAHPVQLLMILIYGWLI